MDGAFKLNAPSSARPLILDESRHSKGTARGRRKFSSGVAEGGRVRLRKSGGGRGSRATYEKSVKGRGEAQERCK